MHKQYKITASSIRQRNWQTRQVETMKFLLFTSLFIFFTCCFSLRRVVSSEPVRANLPPRGWNSYDSFSWIVSEEEFLRNAEIISQTLKAHGYEYVVVDFLWYRKKVPGAYTDSYGFDVIDKWGRLIPDPGRWPSSKNGKGFTEIANKVHKMGLKFGIHVMRGLSTQAYDANTPILDTTTGHAYEEGGRQWRAKDIGIKEKPCAWMTHGFMSVNTNLGAGRAFLRSLYEQYAEWGVDFVKHDCVFGDDYDINEITVVSEVIKNLDRQILYSLSPGTNVNPIMAKEVSGLVNMYRITGDDWDRWGDVASHFNVARDLAAVDLIGAKGLLGNSWPDLDMLPLGWLTDPGVNKGPHRSCRLNLNEQRTQMTLWAMAKSPLMFGGDVRKLDSTTLSLITNPTLLEINAFSSDNKEFANISGKKVTKSPKKGSRRYLMEVGMENIQSLELRSCKDSNVNGWLVKALEQDLKQICWKEKLGIEEPLCLYRRKPLLASNDEQIIFEQGHLHLSASDGIEFCLDASSRWKRTAKEVKGPSFSSCRWNANQMWDLNDNGALISNYSGLCVVVSQIEDNVIPYGVRSWIARGRKGETYVAFFNLNPSKTVISAKISDMHRELYGSSSSHIPCKCSEVWSGRDFEVTSDIISMEVESHGCALFVLSC